MAQQVVTSQPGSVKSTKSDNSTVTQQPSFTRANNTPAQLDYLATLDKVKVRQQMNLCGALTMREKQNKYIILNDRKQQFMSAREQTGWWERTLCCGFRSFSINIKDASGKISIRLRRGLRGQGCCCPCCLQEMEVECPPGKVVGTIKELWSVKTPRLEVWNDKKRLLYEISGPCCWCRCLHDVTFNILRVDGSQAGTITKHWVGSKEMLCQSNDFSVVYPKNEQTMNKAILLGAVFLIDYMYYEIKS